METGERRTVVDAKQLPIVRRIVHGLELGEVGDGPLTLSVDWRRRIDQQAAVHGLTGDLPVEDVRRWIAEVGPTGLDRPVSDLVIVTYALLADRAWVHHGVVVDPPDVDRIGPGYALRAQELPTADEFAAARERVAALFGIRVPDVLFARNVRALADRTQEKVRELEPAVNALWRAMQKHADDLGLAEPGPRTTSAQAAADLLDRLSAARDDGALVRVLARGVTGPSDAVLGTAIVTAPAVLAALDGVEWSLLESVRALIGHDVLGERAARLVDRVAEAARDDQYTRDLVPVLGDIRGLAVALGSEAARLAAVARPAPTPAHDPGPLPVMPAPPVRASGPATVATPITAAAATAETAASVQRRIIDADQVDGLVDELRAYIHRHPAGRFDVVWRALGPDEQG